MSGRDALIQALAPIVEYLHRQRTAGCVGDEDALADLVYRVCHGRQPVDTPGSRASLRDETARREFAAALSVANTGRGFDYSAVARAVEDDGRVMLQYGGLGVWTPGRPGALAGGNVIARFPKEMRNLYQGHYVAIGDADDGRAANPLRLYWNIGAESAVRLVRVTCDCFNAAGVPFRLKLLDVPAAYTRADAAILYLPRAHRVSAAPLVAQVYREHASFMRSPVSAYALPLAPGLSLAEDPPDGSSFGMHRSRLIAARLADGVPGTDEIGRVMSALEASGFDADHLYRNSGSLDDYRDFVIAG